MNYQKHQDFLIELFDGDPAAVALCGMVPTLLNNKNKAKYGDNNIWIALFDIQYNSFYQKHRPHIEPIMQNLFLQWNIVSKLENKGLALAMMQTSSIGFVMAVLHCLKGRDVVLEQGPHIAEFMAAELANSCVDEREIK